MGGVGGVDGMGGVGVLLCVRSEMCPFTDINTHPQNNVCPLDYTVRLFN